MNVPIMPAKYKIDDLEDLCMRIEYEKEKTKAIQVGTR